MVSVCIVGGGIAGLYAAKSLGGGNSVVVLEADPEHVGGRARMTRFAGIPVVRGAGIGRARDKRLRRVLRELGIPERPFRVAVRILHNGVVVRNAASLKSVSARVAASKEYRAAPRTPFGKLAEKVLGKRAYATFLEKSVYTNFERDDATDVILDYGVDDNESGWKGLGISWNALIRGLAKGQKILLGRRATAIERTNDGEIVVRTDDPLFSVTCDVAIVATTVESARRLFPGKYRDIFGQPFIRVYATFDAPSAEIVRDLVPTMTIVERPLKKIVPMRKKNVFMIAYADNADARAVHRVDADPRALEAMVEKALGLARGALRILDVQSHYWPIGTHGYGPLPKKYATRADFIRDAQRPAPDVFVVGEMVSTNQGWVEGALESVDAVIRDIKKTLQSKENSRKIKATT